MIEDDIAWKHNTPRVLMSRPRELQPSAALIARATRSSVVRAQCWCPGHAERRPAADRFPSQRSSVAGTAPTRGHVAGVRTAPPAEGAHRVADRLDAASCVRRFRSCRRDARGAMPARHSDFVDEQIAESGDALLGPSAPPLSARCVGRARRRVGANVMLTASGPSRASSGSSSAAPRRRGRAA